MHCVGVGRDRHRQRDMGEALAFEWPALRGRSSQSTALPSRYRWPRVSCSVTKKGAFTGAAGQSLGVFRAAAGGVVFLDEVGEMPLELQPKLLRVLQQREVTPVGGSHPLEVDVQIVAATNRDLAADVARGTFREDLYYRLNMVELHVPALRHRAEDIPTFIEFFSQKFAAQYRSAVWKPDAQTLKDFCEYDWPGNVRQLAHVIEQSYVLDCAPTLPNSSRSAGSEVGILPFMDLDKLRMAAVRRSPASHARPQRPCCHAARRACQHSDPDSGSDESG